MSAVIISFTDAQDLQVWDSSPAAAAPTWLPRRQTVAYRCGTHFDAVRAPVDIAQVVHDTFDLPGPVIANDSTLTATNAQLIHLTWPLLAAATPHATETTP